MEACHIAHLESNYTNVVTPLLDPEIAATRLVLLVSKDKVTDALLLKPFLSVRGISIEYVEINTEASSNALVDLYIDIFSEQQSKYSNEKVFYNATCGKRRNSLIAYDVARNLAIESYIIEPCLDALHWIHPVEKPDSQLADKLKLKDYFWMHNTQIGEVQNTRGIKPIVRNITQKWLGDLSFYDGAISQLNYLAYTANNPNLSSKKLSPSQLDNAALRTIIDDLETLNKVTLTDSNVLEFPNENARFFANGGWLEEYAFGVTVTLKKEIATLQDIAQGMEVEREISNYTVRNELDVVALNNNKLHIIECKTKKFMPGEGNEVIYKVDSITDLLGGVNGRAMFISLKKVRLAETCRAKELDITFIGPQELPNLKEHLKQWFKMA